MARDIAYYQDDDRVDATAPTRTGRPMVDLGSSYCPRENDVVCTREKRALKHAGNMRLRSLVESRIEEFSACRKQQRRSDIVIEVVATIRSRNPRGCFVRFINNRWVEVDEQIAAETTAQIFRDCVNMYRQRELRAKEKSQRFQSSSRARSASPTYATDPQQYTTNKFSPESSSRNCTKRKLDEATNSEVLGESGERTKRDDVTTRSTMMKPASELESVLWKAIDDVLPPADPAALRRLSLFQLQLIRRLSVEEATPGGAKSAQNGDEKTD